MASNEKYPDFIQSTGYGTGGGLCGWNCRHNFIPFDPKTMTNNIAKYGMEENKEAYIKSQKQRYLERNIRNTKRVIKVIQDNIKNSENLQLEQTLKKQFQLKKSLLKKQQENYFKFCSDNNLRAREDRLKIFK
nr:MAG TPA: minor capsid protein [Caudoviricetes sp.]DAI79256.1 MAG TPA: minor capsid protein [Caudoviricetes sp.]